MPRRTRTPDHLQGVAQPQANKRGQAGHLATGESPGQMSWLDEAPTQQPEAASEAQDDSPVLSAARRAPVNPCQKDMDTELTGEKIRPACNTGVSRPLEDTLSFYFTGGRYG